MTLKELVSLAQDRLMRGELQSALENFQAAVEFCSEHAVGSEKKLPCLANTGACLVTLGRYEESLNYLQEALGLVEVVHSREEPRSETDGPAAPSINHSLSRGGMLAKGDITYNIANAHMGLERYREASADVKISIDCYIKAGAQEHAAEGFVSLSRCERHLQQAEGEIQSLRSAQQLYSDLASSEREGAVVGELLLALLAYKRTEELERCMGSAKLSSMRMTKPREKGACMHARVREQSLGCWVVCQWPITVGRDCCVAFNVSHSWCVCCGCVLFNLHRGRAQWLAWTAVPLCTLMCSSVSACTGATATTLGVYTYGLTMYRDS